MCWARRCCFLIPLDRGCVYIGVGNIIFAGIIAVATSAFLFYQKHYEKEHFDGTHFLQEQFEFEMNKTIIDIVITLALIISVLWIFFSTFLIVGVRKNIPSFVLCYFVYGVILTIICFLASLLGLLSKFFIVAMVQGILCLTNIHFLVVVHTVYELMCRGKIFGGNNHSLIDEEFLEEN